jgi:AmiR/NasT family two-component response regulator
VQWDEGAASRRSVQLKDAGFEVLCETEDGADAYRTARRELPDAVVLDLDHKPGHSRQTARPLAELADPPLIVFVGGEQEVRAKAAEQVPTASFVDAEGLKGELRRGSPR